MSEIRDLLIGLVIGTALVALALYTAIRTEQFVSPDVEFALLVVLIIVRVFSRPILRVLGK